MDPEEIERRLRELRSRLDAEGCTYAILAHETNLHSAEDGVLRGVGSLEEMAPTFILRSSRGFMAAIISGASKLSYKKIRKKFGLTDVSLASPEAVLSLTGSPVGTVSLVQTACPTLLDERLASKETGFGGCGVPGHTLRIRISELIRVVGASVFDFTEPK